MSVEYKPIKVNEWEEFGGGFLCKSFYKKDDDTVKLKLYEAGFDEKEIIKEHDYAVAVRNALYGNLFPLLYKEGIKIK